MISADVIVVGGGPGGSSCARQLKKHGIQCLLLDREAFPRLKLCGGLVTPEVVRHLEIDPATYPHNWLTIERFCFWYKGRKFALRSPQHSIRRIEFDNWLLNRSGAEVHQHLVQSIAPDGDGFVIDDAYRCKYIVGAGGTRCPVYRRFFRDLHPRDPKRQIAALEEEFAWDWKDENCHLWMFDNGLPGYGWYIPKGGGHLNIGIGGMAASLNSRNDSLKSHWAALERRLEHSKIGDGHAWNVRGFTYYMRTRAQTVRAGNAFIVGDAAGLATHDLGEGIGPAVQSGIRAANAIATGSDYSLRGIPRYSAGSLLKSAARRLLRR